MNPILSAKFKSIFESERQKLLFSHQFVNEQFNVQADDLLDEADLTQSELETSMRMRLRSREALFLKKIDEAMSRIDSGSFGNCEKCSEGIEMRRLEARPTTTMCVACKEEDEHREHIHIDGHRSKSLGAKLRLA